MRIPESVYHFSVEDPPGLDAAQMPSLVSGLVKAASIRGEYPTSLQTVEALDSARLRDTSTDSLVEQLYGDPVLTLRILSLVNGTFYSRGTPVRSLSGAANHLGIMKIPEVVRDLATVKSFQAAHLGRAVAATVLHETLAASALARSITRLIAPRSGLQDLAHLVVALSRVGPLMVSYLKPNIFSACLLDPLSEETWSWRRRFRKLLGVSTVDFAEQVIQQMGIPSLFVDLVRLAESPTWTSRNQLPSALLELKPAVEAAHVGMRIARELSDFSGPESFFTLSSDIRRRHEVIYKTALEEALGDLPKSYLELANLSGVKALRLPEYLFRYSQIVKGEGPAAAQEEIKWPSIAERINPFLYELRACFKTTYSTNEFFRFPQAIYCTLNALLKGTGFERAVFLTPDDDEQFLRPVYLLGQKGDNDFIDLRREFADTKSQWMPDIQAFRTRRAVFQGDPMIAGRYPFVAFPAIWDNSVVGVFYADRKESDALEMPEQIALIALAEEWQDVSIGFA